MITSQYTNVSRVLVCLGPAVSASTRLRHSGVTRESGAPRQILKWGPPFFVIIFIIHTIPHDIRVEFRFKLKFMRVCCCNAATKHSMVCIVMPTFYCNYFFSWNSGAPYTRGPPGLCLPCLPHCYAIAQTVTYIRR